MFDVSKDLSVQTWCYRNFKPLDDMIAQVKKSGLSRVELCGCHADFGDDKTFDATIGKFKAAGIAIASIGVQYFNGEAKEEKWFEFAKRAGCKMISASFSLENQPDSIKKTEALAEKYAINLGIHNHGGYDWLGSTRMLAYVFAKTGPRVGLCLDTAWMMQSGEDALKTAEKFAPRLYNLHIKDFIFNRAGKGEDVVVGTGNLQLKQVLQIALTKAPQPCLCTLEYEADAENPAPKITACADAVRKAL